MCIPSRLGKPAEGQAGKVLALGTWSSRDLMSRILISQQETGWGADPLRTQDCLSALHP